MADAHPMSPLSVDANRGGAGDWGSVIVVRNTFIDIAPAEFAHAAPPRRVQSEPLLHSIGVWAESAVRDGSSEYAGLSSSGSCAFVRQGSFFCSNVGVIKKRRNF